MNYLWKVFNLGHKQSFTTFNFILATPEQARQVLYMTQPNCHIQQNGPNEKINK